jgi:hypothetical protein
MLHFAWAVGHLETVHEAHHQQPLRDQTLHHLPAAAPYRTPTSACIGSRWAQILGADGYMICFGKAAGVCVCCRVPSRRVSSAPRQVEMIDSIWYQHTRNVYPRLRVLAELR